MRRVARFVAVAAIAVLIAACAEGDDEPIDTAEPEAPPTPDATDEPADGEEPADEAEPDATEEPTAPEEADGVDEVRVYLVRDHAGSLWLEAEMRPLAQPTQAVATAAITELLTQPPVDPMLVPPAGTDADVLGVDLDGGVLTVDVSAEIRDAATGAAGEEAFAQALAHTGAQFDTVDAVQLLIDGDEITELWGHLDWSDPIEPDDGLLAPVDIDEPRWGAEIEQGTPVTVSGTSVTFESTVELDLVDPDGIVVEETFTTAEQPDIGVRGPFSHTFDTVPDQAGAWTIIATEPDPSDGEGRPPHSSEVQITVE